MTGRNSVIANFDIMSFCNDYNYAKRIVDSGIIPAYVFDANHPSEQDDEIAFFSSEEDMNAEIAYLDQFNWENGTAFVVVEIITPYDDLQRAWRKHVKPADEGLLPGFCRA